MANEEVTTSLNVDITQFKTAMSAASRYIRQANSEFDKATAGVEDWANSADGLRAKINQLNKTLDAQETHVAALKAEYERVSKEQGESSAGAQNLAIRLNKAEAAVKRTKAEIDKYGKALDDTKNNTQDTEQETVQMSAAFDKAAKAAGDLTKKLAGVAGKAVVNGIKGLAAASAGLVTAFLATGEAQKEHITEMAKLDAAYKSAGHSADTAAATYNELYGVIGETDQAVEAAQQIALLAKSEEDAAAWAEQGAAVIGKFGDALQPETFYEAANETFSLNEATGAYVQMIEQCGLSVDDFNKGLQACKTEEEKQAYMLEYTQQALAGAGEAYREANAAVIENNKANAALQEQLAGVGQAALPITTAFKLIGASILGDLMPNIKTLGTSFTEAMGGSKTAAAEMGTAVGSILQTLGKKILDALPTILTVGSSILTSLVQGLVQAVPQLAQGVTQIVQYFIKAAPQLLAAGASMVSSLVDAIRTNLPQLLKSGGEMLNQLLSGLVSNLPAMAQGAMDALGGFVQGIQTYLPIVLDKGAELLGKLGEGIRTALPDLLDQGLDILMNFAETLYDAAPKLIDTGFDLLSDLVQGIMDALPTLIKKGPEIISKFANIINDNFPKILKKGVELIGQIIKGIISAIPTLIANIPKIITAIVDVWQAFNWLQLGKNAITAMKNGITNMVGAIKTAGSNIHNSFVNMVKQLPQNLLNLGKNAITSMKNGITSMVSAVRSAGSNVLSSIVNAISSLPSKLLSFGKNAISNLGSAISSGASTVKSKASSIMTGIVNAFTSLPSKMVNIGKEVINGVISGIGAMVGKLYSSIKDALGGLVDKAKQSLKINSPSKVFRDVVGRAIPEGIGAGIEKYGDFANSAIVDMAKGAVSAANAEFANSTLDVPGPNGNGGSNGNGSGQGGKTFVFNQYNNSPKALSRAEIYRNTKNALRFATSNA
jgi:phage-related protein